MPLFLAHPTSEHHDVTNARGELAFETLEVLVAFGEYERRSTVTYCLDDLVADRPIPRLVIDQELVVRLEFDPLVGARATG